MKGPLDTMDGQDAFIKLVKQTAKWIEQEFGVPLGLAIIDTYAMAFALEDENDNTEIIENYVNRRPTRRVGRPT